MFKTFNEHKETGVSFSILFLMSIFILISNLIPNIKMFNNISYELILDTLSKIFITVVTLVPAIIFEKKNRSFVSHLILFSFYLNPYIIQLLNIVSFSDVLDFLIFILGTIMAIYSLLKMYVHKDELNKINEPNQIIDLVIIISVIKVFLDQGFSNMAVYVLIFIAIIMSVRKIDSLIMSLSIYSASLINNLYVLFRNINASNNIYYYIFLSIIINLFMIVFILKIYRDNDSNYYNKYTN